MRHPARRAVSTSSDVRPPSGPTMTTALLGAGRSAVSASASGARSSSHKQRRSVRSSDGSAIHSASGLGASIVGSRVRPHCLAASRATRCQRSTREAARAASSRTTVRVVSAGATRAMPSSVAARITASSLSPLGKA